MIHSFQAENVLSFLEPVTLDWRLGKAVPEDNTGFIAPSGQRLSMAMAVIGANASGKSNLLKALTQVVNFAARSFHSLFPDGPISIVPNCLTSDQPYHIVMVFEVNGDIYRYELKGTRQQVLFEAVQKKTSRLFSRIVERSCAEGCTEVVIGAGQEAAKNIRRNASIVSWLAQSNVPEIRPVYRYFSNFQLGYADSAMKVPNQFGVDMVSRAYFQRPNILHQAENLLQRWDIGITQIALEEIEVRFPDGETTKELQSYAIHQVQGRKIKLPMSRESNGTQSLYTMLGALLPALETGSVAIVDEIETDLHPHMLHAVLDLFLQPETNPKHAQLLFSTHAVELINRLHKPQIILVEKHDMQSEAWALSDVKGVEERENFAAKYLAGAYGATPRI